MPPRNAFAMRREKIARSAGTHCFSGGGNFRRNLFGAVDQRVFRITHGRSRKRFLLSLYRASRKFIHRKHSSRSFARSLTRTVDGRLIGIARCRPRWRLPTRNCVFHTHAEKQARDEGEYIKLNTKGALRSVYLCFIIGASRENEHAYI